MKTKFSVNMTFSQKFTQKLQQCNVVKPDIFFQSLPGENSAFAVYRLCSIVYVCDSIGISGLRCAIFRSVSEITCG